MPKTAKIYNVILRPLLEEHNKIANLISHLDTEVNSMIGEPEPDTDFIEISISLLDNYIRQYHTIEKEIMGHFEQYGLNLEEKMKVVTMFNDHRESLPLLDRLIELNDTLSDDDGKVKSKLISIKEICDSLRILLYNLGKKYFSNILINDENQIIPNRDPAKPHIHRKLDIDGEIFANCVDKSCECTIRDLSDEGLTICTEVDLEIGAVLEVRCKNIPAIPVLKCEVMLKEKSSRHFCYELKIRNISRCLDLFNEVLKGK